HRNLLATGLEQACHKIQEEMSLIANRRDVNNEKMELAEEIATLCDPKNRVGIIDHIGTNIFGS
ncbi:MAG TPA: hypothetical protein DDW21_01370, partial [Verrucomicrobiales bacterium]|nr:hypothetical protein [Verrucomicrobiales bacterium]